MTYEEFANATVIHRWWQKIVEDPKWACVQEAALRERRFTESTDHELPHLELKSMHYKEGTHDMLRILGEFCHPATGSFKTERLAMEAGQYQSHEQDADLPDHVSARFN